MQANAEIPKLTLKKELPFGDFVHRTFYTRPFFFY
jgi:hypothetical protein